MSIFVQGMKQLGWTDGRNLRIDFRGAGANPGREDRQDQVDKPSTAY
jgi:hypothetical protein